MMELMVAMVISIFGIMALLALHVSLAQGTNTAAVSTEAVTIGNETLEDLRTLRATDMMAKLTGDSATVPNVTVTPYATVSGRTQTYTVSVTVTTAAGSTNVWLIRVLVTWTDDGSGTAHTLPFEAIRTVQEAL
jgi:Tfp pilus assembly protein PilV